MTSDLINQALRRRTDTEDRHASGLNLCPPSVLDDLSCESYILSLAAQLEQVVLGLDLHGNLSLAILLPPAENAALGRVGGTAGDGLVTGEGCVGALRSNLA